MCEEENLVIASRGADVGVMMVAKARKSGSQYRGSSGAEAGEPWQQLQRKIVIYRPRAGFKCRRLTRMEFRQNTSIIESYLAYLDAENWKRLLRALNQIEVRCPNVRDQPQKCRAKPGFAVHSEPNWGPLICVNAF